MSGGPESDTLESARRALSVAGGETLVTVTRERSLLLRFARSSPTQATAVEDLTLEVATLVDGHLGRAQTNSATDESLRACAAAAAEAAHAGRAGGGGGTVLTAWPEPASPRSGGAGWDPETAALDPRRGGEQLAAAFERCARAGAEAHGVWTAGEVETAIASSHGSEMLERVTDAFMKVTAIAPAGRSGYAASTSVSSSDLDGAALADRAAAKATLRGEAAALPAGRVPGRARGRPPSASCSSGSATPRSTASLTSRGAARSATASGRASPLRRSTSPIRHAIRARSRAAFDAEGVPKSPLPLIQDGVAHAVVHDTRSAALAGTRSTGHALAAGGAPEGPLPTNLVLAGGAAADEAELCEPIERGIYVTRLWYTNPVRPREALITGVTRDGTFLIEDGAITRPLADMRMTDSVLSILDRCQELARVPALTSAGEFYGRRNVDRDGGPGDTQRDALHRLSAPAEASLRGVAT